MPAEAPSMSALVLSLFFAACANQEPYNLHFADGRGITGLRGIQSCFDAFRNNVRMKPGGYEGVCASQKKEGGTVVRVRPLEMTNLREGKPPETERELSGKLAVMKVGWDVLPPWARGSYYNIGWNLK